MMYKKLRQTPIVLLAMTGLGGLPGLTAPAQAASGTCGENLTWNLDADGRLTISGNGAMRNNFGWDRGPWRREVKTAVIEDGVTTIGEWAFYGCTGLTSACFQGKAPTTITPGTDSCGTSFDKNTVTLYYIEGQEGWITPEWKGYKTALWDGVNIPMVPRPPPASPSTAPSPAVARRAPA